VTADGVFHKIPRIDDLQPAEIFALEVLSLPVGRGILSLEWTNRKPIGRTPASTSTAVYGPRRRSRPRVGKTCSGFI
jgi:hypothetical protein